MHAITESLLECNGRVVLFHNIWRASLCSTPIFPDNEFYSRYTRLKDHLLR